MLLIGFRPPTSHDTLVQREFLDATQDAPIMIYSHMYHPRQSHFDSHHSSLRENQTRRLISSRIPLAFRSHPGLLSLTRSPLSTCLILHAFSPAFRFSRSLALKRAHSLDFSFPTTSLITNAVRAYLSCASLLPVLGRSRWDSDHMDSG